MIRCISLPILLATPLLALAGCTTADERGAYPSLAPRAVEKLGFAEPEAPTPAPIVADPALDSAIADASKSLASAAAAFDAAATRAEPLVRAARGAKAGSDAWIEAQSRLATLDSLRADSTAVVTDLEDRAITRATALAPDYPSLETARAAAKAQSEAQAARIAGLQGRLAPL